MEGSKPYLGWPDVAEMFGCGRSKAMLIMHEVGVVHVGRSAFVRASDLDAYLVQHAGFMLDRGVAYSRAHAAHGSVLTLRQASDPGEDIPTGTSR